MRNLGHEMSRMESTRNFVQFHSNWHYVIEKGDLQYWIFPRTECEKDEAHLNNCEDSSQSWMLMKVITCLNVASRTLQQSNCVVRITWHGHKRNYCLFRQRKFAFKVPIYLKKISFFANERNFTVRGRINANTNSLSLAVFMVLWEPFCLI